MVVSYSLDERNALVENNLSFIISIIDENNSIITNTTLNQVKRRRSDVVKEIKAYFQPSQRPIAARFVSKIYRILSQIIVPSYASIDAIIEEVLSLLTASSSHIELLRRIHRIEDHQARLDAIYQGRKIDELYNFIVEQKNYVFLHLNRETRDSLLHSAINDDFVECTTLVCIHVKDCHAVNRRNIFGDNCFHLAARQLKIKHLALLLKVHCMDATVLNNNHQSALQLLLISLRNIHFGTTVSIASIEYDVEYMYDLVDRVASRYDDLRDFLAPDVYGFDVFDYTISTHNVRLICMIMYKIEQLAIQENTDFDWSKYLRHAVLLDSPTISGVIAKQYLKSHAVAALTCADFLSIAIIEEKVHALHTLLNLTEFVQAVNTKASSIDRINYNATRTSNANPRQSQQERVPLHHALLKLSCLHSVDAATNNRQMGIIELHCENVLRTLLRYGADPYTSLSPNRIDNCFALAVDQGCINSVRILLLAAATAAGLQSIEHIRCFPHGDKFYFHAKRYHSNPLWGCIKPNDAVYLRLNDYKMLEYLLLHTPFKALINLVSRSGKTPLIVAGMCNRGDLVQLLVQHGANYYTKIDAFNTTHSRSNGHNSKQKINEYRDILVMTPVPLPSDKTESAILATIKSLTKHKEAFYVVPFMCSKDASISSFLFLVYQILKLFDPSLSKVKWIKSFINYKKIVRILVHSLDSRVYFSAEMISKLYICILNALKVADTRYYVWTCANVVLPVVLVEWCKALNAVLDINKTINTLKEWVYTPHYAYPISYLLESIDHSHFCDYALKQPPEMIYHNHRIPILPTSKSDVRYHFWYDYVVDKKWELVRRYIDMIVWYDYHHLEELITCAVIDKQDGIIGEITARGGVIGRYIDHILASVRTYHSSIFCHLLLCGYFDYTSIGFWTALRSAFPAVVQGIVGSVGPLHTSVFHLQSSDNSNHSRSVAEDFAVIQSVIDLGMEYAALSHADNTATIKECLEYADTNRYVHTHDMNQLFHASPSDLFQETVLLPFLEYIVTKSNSHLLFRHVVPIILAKYKQVDMLQLAVTHNNLVVIKCVLALTNAPVTLPFTKAQVVLDKLRHSHYLHRNYCQRINDAISMIDGHELFNDILQLASILTIHLSHLQLKPDEVTHIFKNLASIIGIDATVASGMSSLFVDSSLLSLQHMANIKTIPFQVVVNLLLYVNYYNVVYNKELMKGTSLLAALVTAGEKTLVPEPYREIVKNVCHIAQVIILLLEQKALLEKYCFTLQSTGLYNKRPMMENAPTLKRQVDHLGAVTYYVDKLYHLDEDPNVDIVDKIISINIRGDALLEKFDVLEGDFRENSDLLLKAFEYLMVDLPTPHIPELLLPFVCMSFIDIVLLLENRVIATLIAILITETSYQQIMSMNCGVRVHYAYILARLWCLHTTVLKAPVNSDSEAALEYFNPEYQQAIGILLAEIRAQFTDCRRYSCAENTSYQRFHSSITELLAANSKVGKREILEHLDMQNIHVFFELLKGNRCDADPSLLIVRQQLFAKAASFGHRMNLQALVAAISSNRHDWLNDAVLNAAITGTVSLPTIVGSTAWSVGSWMVRNDKSYYNRKRLLEYVSCIIKSSISSMSLFVARTAPNAPSPVEYAAIGGYWSLVKLLLSSTEQAYISQVPVESLVLHTAILQNNQIMVNFIMSMAAPVLRSYLLSIRSFQVQIQCNRPTRHEKRRIPEWKQCLGPSSVLSQSISAFLDKILIPTQASGAVFSHSIAHDALMCRNVSIMRNILINVTDLLLSEDSNEFHVVGLVHYACYFDHHEVLSMLLTPPWSLGRQIDELVELPFARVGSHHLIQYKWAPIHVAAYCGNTACLKTLLRAILSRESCTPLVTQLLMRDSYKLAVYFKHQLCAVELFKALHNLSISQVDSKKPSMFTILQMDGGGHIADIALLGMDRLLEYILAYMCHECLPVLPAAALRDLFTQLIQVQRYECAVVVYRYIRTLNARTRGAVVVPPAIDLHLFLHSVDEFYPFLRSILKCAVLSKPDLANAPSLSDSNKEGDTRVMKRQDTIDAIISKLRKALPSRPESNLIKLKQSMQRSPQREKKL